MFLNFISQNWQFLVAILVSLISSVLVWLIRKKPVINEMDRILLQVFEKLPEWINSAELLKGADVKMSIVLESVKSFVKSEFSVDLPQSYLDFIRFKIEEILSTPQKK